MVIWNDTKDRQLLLIMIDLTPEEQAAGKKWDTVAAKMGEGFTAQAVRQHLKKIRNDFAKESQAKGDTNGDAQASGDGSPTKPKARKRSNKDATPDEVKKEAGAEDEDEVVYESPKKKTKKKVKAEE